MMKTILKCAEIRYAKTSVKRVNWQLSYKTKISDYFHYINSEASFGLVVRQSFVFRFRETLPDKSIFSKNIEY